ncbi:E3 ubiquitin-protein ligase NEURL1-like [Callorhinchus milii]|uniref:E3 ubiquitin-protein ligase NEURL1-like n=1 Tax=Callorhinchus milii TaxID=7868 RepID=UPI000457217F|nr:E3 ubiquitin-protein ligase NEURL1-like [Callorhinchus milii]|eukprot:gi/632948305/ref/XP_007889533.1/ PREDICTED: E3 ubiquitin-protein ligase NEURL1-like isoform X1 [Callorhinchus milii]
MRGAQVEQAEELSQKMGSISNILKLATLKDNLCAAFQQPRDHQSDCGKKQQCTPHCQLFFNPFTKGSAIQLDSSNCSALRKFSFCNGIIFTNRPVAMQEEVRFRITKTNDLLFGGLRLGCTIFDPSLIDPKALPKFVCPNLAEKPGFWGFGIHQEDVKEGTIISLWVNKKGQLWYRVNKKKGFVLTEGLPSKWPLWVMLDVYGSTCEVQLLVKDMSQNPPLRSPSLMVKEDSDNMPGAHTSATLLPQFKAAFQQPRDHRSDCGEKQQCTPHCQLFFNPSTKGSAIQLDSSNCSARRKFSFCNGIIFTNRPVGMQEEVRFRITKNNVLLCGGLRLGCTIFDPSLIDPKALPKFVCPNLAEKPGFWGFGIHQEDVKEGTIISLWVNKKGQFWYRVNKKEQYLLTKGLPNKWPLWFMLDLYGSTCEVQLLENESSSFADTMPSGTRAQCFGTPDAECIICFTRQVDTFFYGCGHLCTCYICAQECLSRNMNCPMCRKPIKEIIKTFCSSLDQQ